MFFFYNKKNLILLNCICTHRRLLNRSTYCNVLRDIVAVRKEKVKWKEKVNKQKQWFFLIVQCCSHFPFVFSSFMQLIALFLKPHTVVLFVKSLCSSSFMFITEFARLYILLCYVIFNLFQTSKLKNYVPKQIINSYRSISSLLHCCSCQHLFTLIVYKTKQKRTKLCYYGIL